MTQMNAKEINVLIACEESQAETLAFRELGFNAFSCDVQPCKPGANPSWHIHGDVTSYLQGETKFITQDGAKHVVPGWHLIIAHPPCTYLCKVSSPHLVRKTPSGPIINQERLNKMIEGAKFFRMCLNAKAQFVAVENPLPMRRANLPAPSFFIQPSWYGVKYTKKTLWWVRNLPPLMAEIEHPSPKEFVKASRGKYRSRTFPQVAAALARQWGSYILVELSKGCGTQPRAL